MSSIVKSGRAESYQIENSSQPGWKLPHLWTPGSCVPSKVSAVRVLCNWSMGLIWLSKFDKVEPRAKARHQKFFYIRKSLLRVVITDCTINGRIHDVTTMFVSYTEFWSLLLTGVVLERLTQEAGFSKVSRCWLYWEVLMGEMLNWCPTHIRFVICASLCAGLI